MANKPLPSPEVLRQLLRYEPETGKLFWKERGPEWFTEGRRKNTWRMKRWNGRYAGAETGFVKPNGYMQICLFGRRINFHRVAWAIHYGAYPDSGKQIDHIDRDKTNNTIANLRAVTARENCLNKESAKFGAYFHQGTGKWQSAIAYNKKQVYLGLYKTKEDASAAYNHAADRISKGCHPTLSRV